MGGEEAYGRTAALFASLLSLPTDRYPPLEMSPQQQKEETLKTLANQIAALSTAQPVLLIFEDAHWIDPTSQEALDLIVPALAAHAVLAVITHRPEYDPPWLGQGHVTPLALTRLGRADAAAMVTRVSDKPLSDAMLDQIVAKTDGVPLFVEELTKTVVESGAESATAIPETLQDSLMARLDRLSPVKEITQIGACIGREFSYDLLAAVSPQGDNELLNSLTELTNSELIFRRGTPPDASYVFKHALVQDAAYESLLKSTRQNLHTTIAEALENRFPEQADYAPELVAHHYTMAGLATRAIPFWLRAGERTVARFANVEAISHLNQGLDLIAQLPDTDERARQELAIRVPLGLALMMADQYVGPDVEANFRATRAVSEKIKDTAGLAAAFLGLHRALNVSGDLVTAHDQDIENLALAETLGDSGLLTTAHWAIGASHLFLGNFVSAREHCVTAFENLTFENEQSFVASHMEAPGVTCRSFGSLATVLLGYPGQASEMVDEARDIAGRIGHPLVNALEHAVTGFGHYIRGEPREALRASENIVHVCEIVEMPAFETLAPVLRAWALVQLHDETAETELERAREAMGEMLPLWQPMWYPVVLACEVAGGHGPTGIRGSIQAMSQIEDTGVRIAEAELLRLRGELALATPDGAPGARDSRPARLSRCPRSRRWPLYCGHGHSCSCTMKRPRRNSREHGKQWARCCRCGSQCGTPLFSPVKWPAGMDQPASAVRSMPSDVSN